MKKNQHFLQLTSTRIYAWLVVLVAGVFATGCDTFVSTYSYTYYEPVYKTVAEIRNSVRLDAAQPLESPGKIYAKDQYIYISEPGKGIHIIDNKNPEQPVNKSFITLPGTSDLSISGNYLYADSYIDLVVLDISNIAAVHEVGRTENVFTSYNSYGYYMHPTLGVVTEWVEKRTVVVSNEPGGINYYYGCFMYENGLLANSGSFNKAAFNTSTSVGVGGSLARFTLNSGNLYVLDGGNLKTITLSIPTSPEKVDSLYIDWGIETIFPGENKLFIGASAGMHILDIADPSKPVLLSTYAHVRACDPVVVEGDYAYVTLRSGNPVCSGFSNQLEVINIKDPTQPVLEYTYLLTQPYGLGVDESLLFVCDGPDGLKIFNKSDLSKIKENLIGTYKIDAIDVIPLDGLLLVLTTKGLYQFDYSNPEEIKLLSELTFEPNL